MISRDSVLRHLPGELNRKQALYIDGIRHAAEIVGFAHERLQRTLTTLALEDCEGTIADNLNTSAFLDAWAIVDAVDRFRTLWQLIPHTEAPLGRRSFAEIATPIRKLRNVADHLAQRVDYVVAHNGSALGVLSWLTVLSEEPLEVLSCNIVPGTLQSTTTRVIKPMGKTIETPSDHITLAAGEYEACLSEVLPEIESRIRELERSISNELTALGLDGTHAGADLILKVKFSARGEQFGGAVDA